MERVTDGRRAAGFHEVGEDHGNEETKKNNSPKIPHNFHTGNIQIGKTFDRLKQMSSSERSRQKNLTIIHTHIHYCFSRELNHAFQ